MQNAYFSYIKPTNEPILGYLPGSPERKALDIELEKQKNQVVQIPLIIGGKEVWTEQKGKIVMPHDHNHVLAEYCIAGPKELQMAVDAAMAAKEAWADMPFHQRSAIFLRAANALSGPKRAQINASTMLGQSKTVYQAEIDAACELIDFLTFGVYGAEEIFKNQPDNIPGSWNRQVYRPLDGFVAAVTPFNFVSIAGNLGSAPAIMGNVVVWKPSSTAVLSNYYFMKLLEEAGLPAGVMNFVPSRGTQFSEVVVSHPDMAGFHFTGSTAVFNTVWENVGKNIDKYKNYPRLVGETGGKDFIFAHPSARVDALVAGIGRAAFEYQGQKCSACSRAYIPKSLWPETRKGIEKVVSEIKMGDVTKYSNFLGAVIDKTSFDNIATYLDYVKKAPDAEIIMGGKCDDSKGYFVEPTVVLTTNPKFKTMVEEIFGPVLTVYVYDDDKLDETLELCDTSSVYALTGAIYAEDRAAVDYLEKALRNTAGNFYINEKCTGAVVGRQPFGGARKSGTNDKAGTTLNLMRWVSPRLISETLNPNTVVTYPYMVD